VLAPNACMQASDATSGFTCFLARCRVVEKKQWADRWLEIARILT
jgi:hypothetical protein